MSILKYKFVLYSIMIQKFPKHKQIEVPDQLKNIPDAPNNLYVIGENFVDLLTKPRVAIVGSRKMSPYGKSVTQKLTEQLVNHGVIIVSGLAYGVDACAQSSAIDAGGRVIAVLAHGLDQIYPKANTKLAESIIKQGGALVSEYSYKVQPLRHNFLARNRIISGLSDAVLITEAAERSGSLNTAVHALDQGIPVMAVPGNINSQLSAGTNNLIKSGAHLITSVEDILEILGLNTRSQVELPIAISQEEYVLLTLINKGISDGAELLLNSQLEPAMFNQTLTMLEISGKIKPLGNNHWTIN